MTTKTKKTEQVIINNQHQKVDLHQKYNIDELFEKYTTKSNIIRYLDSEGCKRADIGRFLNIRYQHVRNVLTQPLKRK